MAANTSSSFQLFSSLPPDIRFMIWEVAQVPRVHHLLYDKNTHAITSSCPIPAILSACSESRNRALLSYRILESVAHDDTPQHRWDHIKPFYFHVHKDVVYLDLEMLRSFSPTFFSRFDGSFIHSAIDEGSLKKVALDEAAWMWLFKWHSLEGQLRKDSWLRSLSELFFIVPIVDGKPKQVALHRLRGTWRFGASTDEANWSSYSDSLGVFSNSDGSLPLLRKAIFIYEAPLQTTSNIVPVQTTKKVGESKTKKSGSKLGRAWRSLDQKVKDNTFLSGTSGSGPTASHTERSYGVHAWSQKGL